MEKQDVIDLILSSKSESEWQANYNSARAAFEGSPLFWYYILYDVSNKVRKNFK